MDNPQRSKEGRGVGFWAMAFLAFFFFLFSVILTLTLIGSFAAWRALVPGDRVLKEEYLEETVEGSGEKKIVMIPIQGIIRSESMAFLPDESAVVEVFKKQLEHIKKDARVEALLLRIDSPGGGITASDIIYNEIIKYKEETKKKVVACMGDVAASGGYYISVGADKIVAHPTTVTGSIGVIMPLINVSGLIQRYGIEDKSITSGAMKDIGSPTRPMRPEEEAVLKEIIQEMYNRFVTVISKGRNMDIEDVKRLADGRIYTAQQAQEKGLVDQVGYISDAIKLTKELAGLKEARVIKYRKRWQLSDLFKVAGGRLLPNVSPLGWPSMDFPKLMYLWPGFPEKAASY
ncbi:MAG TPA: signal peptide peptidase SppA [Candidatus Hypogeohydataceae bacterium YC38]